MRDGASCAVSGAVTVLLCIQIWGDVHLVCLVIVHTHSAIPPRAILRNFTISIQHNELATRYTKYVYTQVVGVCVCVCVVTLLVQLALGGVRARARVPFSVNSRTVPAPYAGYHVRLPKFMHGTPARTPGADR